MPNEPTTEAINAFNALITGISFPSITDDITDSSFNLPAQTGILYDAPTAVDIDYLTSTTVDGSGIFDKLMTAVRAHLNQDYDNHRIDGAQLVQLYQTAIPAVLQNAVNFAVTANASTYQNAALQMQARAAEADAITARLNAVNAKFGVITSLASAENAKAEYALTKMNIGIGDITYSKVEQEVDLVTNQAALTLSEKSQVDYNVSDILPEQKRKLTYEVDNVLVAQVAKVNYETANILPKQAAILTQDERIKTFQRDNIMVAQENVLEEQYEVQRAQTLDTRSDATTVAGAIGKQKDLYSQQILSYQHDARLKGAKLWADAWTVQKSLDEGLTAPTQFTNAEVDEVLDVIKTQLSLGTA